MQGTVASPQISAPSMQDRYAHVEKSLDGNKFRMLLHRQSGEDTIKTSLVTHLGMNGHEVNLNRMERDVRYVRDFFKGMTRIDKSRLAYTHPLCVGLNIAMIGYSYKEVQKGFLHDCIEDAGKFEHNVKYVKEGIKRKYGSEVYADVEILTKKPHEEFMDYLGRIFNLNKVGVFMLKFLDNLENLKGLYFEDVPQALVDKTIEKSLKYVYILKKVNKELFELMLGLIKGIAPEKFANDIAAVEGKSKRQRGREHRGYVILNPRENIDLSLLQALPYAGSPVVTVYFSEGHPLDTPTKARARGSDHIEIELPDFVGDCMRAEKLLRTHYRHMEFEHVQSRLTPLVACTHIFRAQSPDGAQLKQFFNATYRLGKDLGDIYNGNMRGWAALSSVVNFMHEL